VKDFLDYLGRDFLTSGPFFFGQVVGEEGKSFPFGPIVVRSDVL